MKLPAVFRVTLAEPPGFITGVVNPPLSARASCGATSLFTKVTVEPRATVTGLGVYAVVVRPNAPFVMVIVVEAAGGGVGAGGVGVGAGFESLPHAARLSPATRTSA